ncbi:GNAT family N-acetyltransferase, partial [Staphylococcus aureus]|uniref:GNAT family N-acetyltransferase n=1 Tax=Staphylococcus aureus TaxID=1280 RepID=UPI00210DF532
KKRLQEQLFLVVEEGNDIVTFANFIYGEVFSLSAHYVKPESPLTGYGTALLNERLSRFEDKFEGVYLEVDTKNEEAVAYYKEQGFTILRSHQTEMYGEKLDLALMYTAF